MILGTEMVHRHWFYTTEKCCPLEFSHLEVTGGVAPSGGRCHLPRLCLQHLGCVVPDSVGLLEMICESCMNKNTFLWTYAAHLAGIPPQIFICVPSLSPSCSHGDGNTCYVSNPLQHHEVCSC